MMVLGRILAGLMLVLLAGCGQFERLRHSQQPLVYVDQLVAEQRYGQALAFLAELPQLEQPALLQRHQQLRQQAQAYEQELIAAARGLAERRQWPQALAGLEQGLLNYPQSGQLAAVIAEIEAAQQAELKQQWQQLNQLLGRNLPAVLAATEGLVAAGEQSAQARRIQQFYADQARRLASYFSAQGQQQLQQRQWRRAQQSLQLADSLRAEPQHRQQLLELQRRLRPKPAAKPVRPALQALLDKFELLLQQEQLPAARDQLQALRRLYPEADLAAAAQRLAARIDLRVEALTTLGRKAYARGELEVAIELWQQGLSLRPDEAELLRLQARAKAFKARYERLRQQP